MAPAPIDRAGATTVNWLTAERPDSSLGAWGRAAKAGPSRAVNRLRARGGVGVGFGGGSDQWAAR